jgi:DNA-binding NarL/FixJ family response regulator
MIRILIADDHAIVRSGLKQLTATTTDIVIAGEATHGIEVVNKLGTCDVDLLLLDMPRRRFRDADQKRRDHREIF